jgi:hypothetical protein
LPSTVATVTAANARANSGKERILLPGKDAGTH